MASTGPLGDYLSFHHHYYGGCLTRIQLQHPTPTSQTLSFVLLLLSVLARLPAPGSQSRHPLCDLPPSSQGTPLSPSHTAPLPTKTLFQRHPTAGWVVPRYLEVGGRGGTCCCGVYRQRTAQATPTPAPWRLSESRPSANHEKQLWLGTGTEETAPRRPSANQNGLPMRTTAIHWTTTTSSNTNMPNISILNSNIENIRSTMLPAPALAYTPESLLPKVSTRITPPRPLPSSIDDLPLPPPSEVPPRTIAEIPPPK